MSPLAPKPPPLPKGIHRPITTLLPKLIPPYLPLSTQQLISDIFVLNLKKEKEVMEAIYS